MVKTPRPAGARRHWRAIGVHWGSGLGAVGGHALILTHPNTLSRLLALIHQCAPARPSHSTVRGRAAAPLIHGELRGSTVYRSGGRRRPKRAPSESPESCGSRAAGFYPEFGPETPKMPRALERVEARGPASEHASAPRGARGAWGAWTRRAAESRFIARRGWGASSADQIREHTKRDIDQRP